jgi:hypothetical protein
MLQRHERRGPLDYLTEAEILSAIRYLDPDLEPERIQRDASKMSGVVILLTTIVGVVTYICLYFGRL